MLGHPWPVGIAGAALALLSAAVPGSARANELDEAVERYEEAEFEAALALFERAEARSDLTRADAVRLLRTRALVHLAMDNEAAMRADMMRLATLEPELGMGPEVPPQVAAAYRDALQRTGGRRLALEVDAAAAPGGARIRASVTGDEGALVRRVRIAGRADGGAWDEGDAALEVEAAPGGAVDYYVEAIGPGGSVLASQGSPTAPLVVQVGPSLVDVDDEEDGVPGWVFGVIGGAVAAVVAVVLIVVLAGGGHSRQTQLSPPMVPE